MLEPIPELPWFFMQKIIILSYLAIPRHSAPLVPREPFRSPLNLVKPSLIEAVCKTQITVYVSNHLTNYDLHNSCDCIDRCQSAMDAKLSIHLALIDASFV